MNSKVKQCISVFTAVFMIGCSVAPAVSVHANEVQNLQNHTDSLKEQSNNLEADLASTREEIKKLSKKIADAELELEEITNDIDKTEEQLNIAKKKEDDQYASMKERIKYMYENGGSNLVTMILEANSMSDFLNKVDFVQNISEYDRGMLDEYKALTATILEQNEYLQKQKNEQDELIAELGDQRKELKAKAKETSADIASINAEIDSLKAQLRVAREEEARKQAAEAAARKAAEQQASNDNGGNNGGNTGGNTGNTDNGGDNGGNTGGGTTDNGNTSDTPSTPSYPGDSGGALTPEKGVVYYNGHKETYYSQKVLPGGGLNIPGRHVASDGTIRDADGYICVASSDLAKGTVVNTSLGPGKVYDSGCASGTIDIYTNW